MRYLVGLALFIVAIWACSVHVKHEADIDIQRAATPTPTVTPTP